MKRRDFVLKTGLATGGLLAAASHPFGGCKAAPNAQCRIRWTRPRNSQLFSSVSCDGGSMAPTSDAGLLSGVCRLWSESPASVTRLNANQVDADHGPLRVALRHALRNSGTGQGEDVLEAVLTARNMSDRPLLVRIEDSIPTTKKLLKVQEI